jgi:3-deoxy-D-manno-octulosonic-acid transferase
MTLLYNFSVFLYGFVIRISALFNPKARSWVAGRKNWIKDLENSAQTNPILFHCASLGEFDQAVPLIQLIKENNPHKKVVVSFFSPSGMEHYHKRNAPIENVFYLPLDSKKNMKIFIEKLSPEMVILVKYEFWHYLISETKKASIPLYSISTLLRQNHRFFKWYGKLFRNDLRQFDHFFVQNNVTAELLKSIGIHNYLVTGDTRIDKVISNLNSAQIDSRIEEFCKNEEVLILGSSWGFEERILKESQWYNSGKKIIIAPHDVSDQNVQRLKQIFANSEQYTQPSGHSQILIIDTIGQLSNAYQFGKIAFIGGGETGKLHNILEPAAFGLPIIFGPKYQRFPEAVAFVNEKVGLHISNVEEFNSAIQYIESNRVEMSQKIEKYIDQNKGAANRIYENLFITH